MSMPGGEAERATLIARMIREAKSAARLNHPGIVTIHDVIKYEDVPWIVMERVPGTSLESVLKQEGTLPSPRAAAIVGRVVRVRPLGRVQRMTPGSGCATRQPGACFARWWARQGACRLHSSVAPPG